MARLLRRGSRGPDVTEVQAQLNGAGGSRSAPLAADGIFGSKTHARVVEFQRANGLSPDGIVGPKTLAALGAAPRGRGGGGKPTPGGGGGRPTPGGGGGGNVAGVVVSGAKSAHMAWRGTATFSGINIQSGIAMGGRGCLSGPNLGGMIRSAPGSAGLSGSDRGLLRAAADGIGSAFAAFQSSVSVPGLPWYPMFVDFPGPMAPPMPNVATPLMALAGNSGSITSASSLHSAMSGRLGGSGPPNANDVLGSIAAELAVFFSGWLAGAMVQNVLGQGPVPTFAPPVVMSGPVIGGSVLPTGGHF